MSTKSSSSSSQSNQTLNEDSRIVADNGATVLGKGASITVNDQFSDGVSNAFKELIGLSRDTIKGASDLVKSTTDKTAEQTSGAVEAIQAAFARSQAGDKSIYTDLFPIVALVAVGVLVVVLIKRK